MHLRVCFVASHTPWNVITAFFDDDVECNICTVKYVANGHYEVYYGLEEYLGEKLELLDAK
jgi:hypothetical protein